MFENAHPILSNSLVVAIANHLWQSTLVAAAVGLSSLALRKHRARIRYWLWLAASLKFLVPFSLLVAAGHSLARIATRPPSADSVSWFSVVDSITQPFTRTVAPAAHQIARTPASSPSNLVLSVLLIFWFLGFAAVLVLWSIRWRRISAAMKSAELVSDGREVRTLRRVELIGGIRRPISVLLSRASLEPGIFGIARPVLLWPEGISHRLEDAHLEAILAHEVWHVRRFDNFYAALHMLVEAVFWFYPLVWWLGARLLEEREFACDEEVVALGGDRHVYAESILKVCEFCLGSPLPCVSGVTGADLKKRMVHIMNARMLHNLGLVRKLLLAVAATLAVALPVTIGLLTATPGRAQTQIATANIPGPIFSSVSIKPDTPSGDGVNHTKTMFSLQDGTFAAMGVTLKTLVGMAYHVQDSQISGGPDWLNTAKFDIEAKLDPSLAAAFHQQMMDKKPISDNVHQPINDQVVLQSLLTNQFKLSAHQETQDVPAYDLVVDEGGPKLQQSDTMRFLHMGPGQLTSQGIPIEILVAQLSTRLGRAVVDKTGLKGNYAFDLRWTPDANEQARMSGSGAMIHESAPVDPNGPSLTTALQQQLGLKLEPHTEPVPVLVIDHAEQPSQN